MISLGQYTFTCTFSHVSYIKFWNFSGVWKVVRKDTLRIGFLLVACYWNSMHYSVASFTYCQPSYQVAMFAVNPRLALCFFFIYVFLVSLFICQTEKVFSFFFSVLSKSRIAFSQLSQCSWTWCIEWMGYIKSTYHTEMVHHLGHSLLTSTWNLLNLCNPLKCVISTQTRNLSYISLLVLMRWST